MQLFELATVQDESARLFSTLILTLLDLSVLQKSPYSFNITKT